MNMPFEYGVDFGFRRSDDETFNSKKFLIFEDEPYELKRALSDIAGQDIEFHRCRYELIIKKIRNFFRVEMDVQAPGPTRLIADYATFLGWMTEKKIFEGHSEDEAVNLPTAERLEEMNVWIRLGKPFEFDPGHE